MAPVDGCRERSLPRSWSFSEMTKFWDQQRSEGKGGGDVKHITSMEHVCKVAMPGPPKEAQQMPAWIRSQLVSANVTIITPFGRRQLTYADDVASGRGVHFVEDVLRTQVLPLYGNTHTEDSTVGEAMSNLLQETAQFVRFCLGAESRDFALFFTGTGSTGAVKKLQEMMGLAVSPMLREWIWERLPRDKQWVVFLGPYEHHSNLLSWQHSLAEVVEIPLNAEGLLDMEFLESELGLEKYRGRPKVGSFSACSNVTGVLTDTRAVARILHKHGAHACFDFAASGPYMKIDMRAGEEDGYDAIFLSPHKFLGGPGSSGLLVMHKSLYALSELAPSTAGGGTVHYVNGKMKETVYVNEIEEREDAGTPGIIQRVRTALAFYLKEASHTDAIEKRELDLTRRAMQRLSANPRILILGNTKAPRLAIFSFLVIPGISHHVSAHSIVENRGGAGPKPLHPRFVVKLLNDLFGIQARGGCACAGPYAHSLLGISRTASLAIKDALAKGYQAVKPGWVRLNFAYFSCDADFEFLISALEFIAENGKKLLPLYDLDWKTGRWTFREDVSQAMQSKERYSAVNVPVSGWNVMRKLLEDMHCEQHKVGIIAGTNEQGTHANRFTRYFWEAKHALHKFSFLPHRERPIPADLDSRLVTFLT